MSFEILIFLVLGLVALFIGAEGLIRGSSALALKIGIPPLVVGVTVVAFGTSTPELVVSLKAAVIGNSSISLGNIVGSNIANISLILGISAIIRPLDVHANIIRREIPIMIGVSLLLILLLLDGELGFIDGLILFVGIVIVLGLFQRRWRSVLCWLGLCCFLAVVVAGVPVCVESYQTTWEAGERYSLRGWYSPWLVSAHLVGLGLLVGLPLRAVFRCCGRAGWRFRSEVRCDRRTSRSTRPRRPHRVAGAF